MSAPTTAVGYKRQRSHESWYVARQSQSVVERVYPQFVDQGALSAEHQVRFDAKQNVYDLRDALLVGHGSESAVKRASKMGNGNFGLSDDEIKRLKWSDCDTNCGVGRIVCDAKTCARVLRASVTGRSRIQVEATAVWFEEQAKSTDTPPLLLSTFSAYAEQNKTR